MRFAAGVLSVASVVALLNGVSPRAQSQLPEVVLRATKYVDTEFVPRFASVVAEEHYTQETSPGRRRRELKSDYLLVTPPGQQDWYQFRDTYEVDGMPVPNRERRLERLFLEPPADVLQRAAEISKESERYNLEDIGTLNRPLTTLAFLQARYVTHFRFTTGRLDKEVGPDVRIVQFNEYVRPSILKAGANIELPAHGLVWIEQATGRVMKTVLDIGSGLRANQSTTTFRFDPDLQVTVPVEMHEEWQVGRTDLKGVATYGRFRRFGVRTEERIK